MTTGPAPHFAGTERAAQWARVLLIATVALSIAGFMSNLLQVDLIERAVAGGVSQAEAAANDARQQLVGLLQLAVYIATAIAFLAWFYGAHRNLGALGGRELTYTPGWAIGWFFVPVLGLVRPLQVMREVWHGSDPDGLERDGAPDGPAVRNKLGTPALVGWWWALFLISGMISQGLLQMGRLEDPTVGHLQMITLLQALADVIDIPAAVMALLLVGRITEWQGERHRLVLASQGAVVAGAVADPKSVE